MRLPKAPTDPEYMLGHLKPGKMLVTIDRGDYWQCAMVIRKDGFDQIKQRGIQKFRDDIADVAPFLRDRTSTLRDWNDVSLLSVRVDRLRKWWRPGLLCIGDAAHAMSPVGGIGINLAIQDAVATANICADRLREKSLVDGTLEVVQMRRLPPTKLTQALQIQAHKRVVEPALERENKFLAAPIAVAPAGSLPVVASISGSRHRHGIPARACAHKTIRAYLHNCSRAHKSTPHRAAALLIFVRHSVFCSSHRKTKSCPAQSAKNEKPNDSAPRKAKKSAPSVAEKNAKLRSTAPSIARI